MNNDTMSIILAVAVLALSGVGVYVYNTKKSEDTYDFYEEDSSYSEDENNEDDTEDDTEDEKYNSKKNKRTKKNINNKNSKSKRRY